MANLSLWRVELLNDPIDRGYAAMNDQQVVDDVGTLTRTRQRQEVPAWEIVEALLLSEVAALTAAQRGILQAMISSGTINVQGPNTRQIFLDLFGAGTTTRANLAALQTEAISRADEIGAGIPHAGDVGAARA